VTVAELRTTPALSVLSRQLVPGIPRLGRLHDVSPDGRQFLVSLPEAEGPTVLVSVNWAAGLRQRPAD
jgi:hypothetical protein